MRLPIQIIHFFIIRQKKGEIKSLLIWLNPNTYLNASYFWPNLKFNENIPTVPLLCWLKHISYLIFLTLYISFSYSKSLRFFMHQNLVFHLIYPILVIIFARLSVTVLSPVIRHWLWLNRYHNVRELLGTFMWYWVVWNVKQLPRISP